MRILLALLALGLPAAATATPSTQIWIPSTDIQPYKVVQLNFDTYLRVRDEDTGTRKAPVSVIGPTIGVLPAKMIQAEAGFDLMTQGQEDLDDNPLYFHAKLGTPEGDRLDVLATLIDSYEQAHCPMDPPDPIDFVHSFKQCTFELRDGFRESGREFC